MPRLAYGEHRTLTEPIVRQISMDTTQKCYEEVKAVTGLSPETTELGTLSHVVAVCFFRLSIFAGVV